MRVGTVRWLTFAAVVVPFAAVVAGAQPPVIAPPPSPLPVAPAPGAKKIEEPTPGEMRAKLMAEAIPLLKRISEGPPLYPPAYPPGGVTPPKPKTDATPGVMVDEIRAAMNRFRDNDFETARRTFRLIDPALLGNEDRAFVRYMLACCHRRLGNLTDAETIYREVANSPDDEFLASCAVWQLSLIRSEKELLAQLEQLRSRAKSK